MYCQYQLQCGFDGDQNNFEKHIFTLLTEYERNTGVIVTAYFTFGRSVYAGKYPCEGEDIVQLDLGTNPIYVTEAKPHVEHIAKQLADIYNQYVIPCHGTVLSSSVFCVKST